MGTENLKIVDFDAVRERPIHHAAAELKVLLQRHLDQQIKDHLAVVDDQLFKLSGMAKTNAEQTQYFEAMRYLRLEANPVRAQYGLWVVRAFDEFWKQVAKRPAKAEGAAFGALPEAELSLVDEAALEEELAIKGMVDKGRGLFPRELQALDARLAHMAGRDEIAPEENPLAPEVLCHALGLALQPLALELPVRLLIYKLYDQVVVAALGGFYREANACLIQQGVLPKLAATPRWVPLPAGGLAARPGEAATAYLDGSDEGQPSYLEAFAALESLMGDWRARMGLPSFHPADYTGPTFATGEVLSVLNRLQQPGVARADAVKGYLHQQLRVARADDTRPIARREEDLIDMVSLLFEFILADDNLPDSVKALISRLQIPVIKVAILEKSLLGRKNHPVRLLLNALAQAGIGLDPGEGIAGNPVFKRIEATVHRVLDQFDQDVNLFSELLDEFTAFMQKENQRSGVAEERARQATQSKEQMRIAKHKVAYEIASRLHGKPAPAVVRSFLFNIWKDVLVLGYLRRDRTPADWENSLAVMDRLVWSVTVPVDAAHRAELVNAIPPLLKSIKVGLEVLSLDPQAVVTILKDLRACHIARLSRPLDGAESAVDSAPAQAVERPGKVEIRDPELARAIVDIRANLPDVEAFSLSDFTGLEGFQVEDIAAGIDPAAMDKARGLGVGEWVEFRDGGSRTRAKLSWKSQLTSTYVFVNRKGCKVAEIPLVELAKRLGEGGIQLIEGGTVPLMDRALHGLLSRLRESPPKEALLNAAV